jgi:hypothetical protein
MCVKLLVEHCYNISPKKYHKNAREDLKELGIRPKLYVEEIETG